MDCVRAMRRKWTGDAANACAYLFGHLFWSYRGDQRKQIVELGRMKRPFGLDLAWEPETTKEVRGGGSSHRP